MDATVLDAAAVDAGRTDDARGGADGRAWDLRIRVEFDLACRERRGEASNAEGTYGHCCVDDQLLSCFCSADAACHFGVACREAGCIEGDVGACAAQDR